MAGRKRTGIKEIARIAGVSIATVSRVLNGNNSVDPALSGKVLEVADSLGYQPSPAARYMRSKESGLIGIVVPKLSNAYFSDMVSGAIDRANENGLLVVVGTVEGKRKTEEDFLKKLSNYMLDGLIYCPVSAEPSAEELDILRQVPLVVAGRRKVLGGVPHVNTDDEKSGYVSTRYLMNLGRKSIAFYAGFWEQPPFENVREMIGGVDSALGGSFSAMDRLRGYRRALSEAGVSLSEKKMVFCSFDAETGYAASQELFSRLEEIDGMIVPNCIVASGVYRFFEEQGIRIPEDISLVSMDDMNIGGHLTVPTTSIQHNMHEVGAQAVAQLNRLIAGEDAGEVVIDVRLQIRRSTVQKSFSQNAT